MTYFVTCAILNFLTSVFCGLLVILKNPKAKTNQTFFYYSFFVSIWALYYFLWMGRFVPSESLLFHSRICNLAAVFIPVTFFHFTTYLVNERKRYAFISICFYGIAITISLFGFTELFIEKMEPLLFFPNWPIGGPIFITLLLEYIVIIGYALIIIYKKIKTSTGQEKLRFQYVFYGILLAYIGGSTNFPLCFRIPIPPYLNILVVFYTILITYAIFKYQLMDIKIVLKRGLVYSILITLITLFYFLSIYLTAHIFQEMFGYKSFLFSLLCATMIALIFIPLKDLIQKFIEKTLFRGSYVEIAEQNEMLRQEVIQTEKLKSVATLASGMAHEIKNPLTVLKTFSEFLPQKIDDKAFLKKFGPMIAQEVNRIDNLVHELLDFAKPAPPVLKKENLYHVLNSTLELLSNEYIKYNIQVHKNYQEVRDVLLEVDHNQIKQALLNILLNAIDAMKEGGQLYVLTTISKDKVQIKIQDTGPGINPKDLPHIFDPFFSKKDNGTGLGLSITHEIIKKHGGRIFAESLEGKGTTFILELPLPTAHPS